MRLKVKVKGVVEEEEDEEEEEEDDKTGDRKE